MRHLLPVLLTIACLQQLAGGESVGRIADARAAKPGAEIWHLQGTVILLPGTLPAEPNTFYMQDDSGGISVRGLGNLQLDYSSMVAVEGTIRLIGEGEPELLATQVTFVRQAPRIVPRELSISEAYQPKWAGRLVRLRGLVAKNSIGNLRDDLFIGQNGKYLRAYFRRPLQVPSVLPTQAPVGAEVEVTGILLPSSGELRVLRLRESVDLALIHKPSLLTSPGFLAGLGAVGGIGILAIAWIVTLRRSIRRQTAEILGLLAEAEESSRLKSEFLANLSHEIRTPIHGIQGMHALLLESPLSAEQMEELTIAQESTTHLLALLDDVLDLSRIEAGRLALETLPFGPTAVVKGVVRSFLPKARHKGLTLECKADELPDMVSGDATRLRQILFNLLGNAVKFTERGRIEVEAWVEDWRDDGVQVGFRVTDTGIGIPLEKQALIFESFRQVDGTISRRYGGSGLGLAIAQRLAKQMGGTMSVRSEPGVGSAFEFWVLFGIVGQQPGKTKRSRSAEEPSPATPLRVLVAEDNEVNQRLVRRILEKDGHAVTVVPDGRSAVSAADPEAFDVILMDVQMPGMDGLQAATAIREHERQSGGARLPIFALTAHNMTGDRERCLAAGMDECLVKPFLPSDLRNLLAGVMRTQS
jgi:signal transduction histidine kinase/ActR/RegA family two-component response regulator